MTVVYEPGYARPSVDAPVGFDIEIGNPMATAWRPLGGYMNAEFEWDWNLPTNATIRITGDHPMAGYLVQCRRKVIHVRTTRNGIPWDGRVMRANVKGKPGREVITLTCISNLVWLMSGLVWVNNLLPPEFQINLTGKQNVKWGPPDMVFKLYLAEVMTRLRKPVYGKLPVRRTVPELPDLDDIDTLDDLLDIVADTLDEMCVLQARATPLDELFEQTVQMQEIGLSCHLWSVADGKPSPTVFNTDTLAQLQSVIDYTSDNFLNFTNPGNILGLSDPSTWNKMTRSGYVFDTHTKRDMRKIQFRIDSTQVEYYERDVAHATAHKVLIGGKAPEIMNQVIEWGANFALQLLLNALFPGLNLGTILVGDLFDDVFFAFQQFWDPDLEEDLGEHGLGEKFGDNTAAWSLDAWANGQATLKENSGSDAVKIQLSSGTPDGRGYCMGVDDGTGRRYQVGDIVTLWDRGTTIEQWISNVKVVDSGDGRMVETVTLGQDRAKDGWERVFSHLQNYAGIFRGIANSV